MAVINSDAKGLELKVLELRFPSNVIPRLWELDSTYINQLFKKHAQDALQYEVNDVEELWYYIAFHMESEGDFVYIYDYLFMTCGIQVSFFNFEISVLYQLNVTPTQLHVNGWTFMMGIQISCLYPLTCLK
ncbi:hypothetical protein CR513_08744, partial [Mucuna pruriens]